MAKRGTLDHPKNKRLARALNTFHGVTLGLLETIWHQAAQFHSNGVMSRLDIEDAMDAGGWLAMFQIEQVIAQLTSEKHKWLDVLPDGNFYIHDWHLHCDDSTHAKLYRSLARFGNGTNPKAAKVYGDERKELELKWSQLQPWIPAGYPPVPLPCHSLPSLAKPIPTLPHQPCVALEGEECVKDFPPEVVDKAREIFHKRWFWLKGCLPNLNLDSAKQEYREIADNINSKPNGYEKYRDYFGTDPPPDHGKTAKLWLINQHLFGSSANGKNRDRTQAPGGGRIEGLDAPSL